MLAEAAHGDERASRIGLEQVVWSDAPPLHHAGREILDDHVGLVGKRTEDTPSFARLEVERNAPLAAIRCMKVLSRLEGRHAGRGWPDDRGAAEPRIVGPVRALDLDDIGAKVAERDTRRRPGPDPCEIEYAKPFKLRVFDVPHPLDEREGRRRSASPGR